MFVSITLFVAFITHLVTLIAVLALFWLFVRFVGTPLRTLFRIILGLTTSYHA